MPTNNFETTVRDFLAKYLSDDLVNEILDKYVGPRGIVLFQRKFRKYLSLKQLGWRCYQCEDCKHYFWASPEADNNYHITNACCDLTVGLCCWKYKCPWNCVFPCSKCRKPTISDYGGWIDSIQCKHCNYEFTPNFVWYGLSPEQHLDRYGY